MADVVYFVRMDFVDGSDLASLLRRERLGAALALLLAEETALAYLHDATDDAGRPLGLVHRDVSPGNILVSRAGEVKLGDLGIVKATMLADVTRANIVKGKYAYMSPEQASGQGLDASSDQFALGVTLAELLTGQRPYEGDTPLETMDRIREAKPPALEELDADLRQLVRRCLERDPQHRFDDDEALRAAIATCRRDRPAAPVDLGRLVRENAE